MNRRQNKLYLKFVISAILTIFIGNLYAQINQPRLDPTKRLSQSQFSTGTLSLHEIRKAGLIVFTTPFNKLDGHGDGQHDPQNIDNRLPGNRPTIQGNSTYLRINGLDAQACLECHTITSNATIPATLGIGGVGGISQMAIVQPDFLDVTDVNNDGVAEFTGRMINPPFLFGSGGVELVGLEMTRELQNRKIFAIEHPNIRVDLLIKGVNFGSIIADVSGNIDTSQIVGVSDDLVIKPFGRKGEFATVREFDVAAMAFHLGMQATELVGDDVDADGDGIINEITRGDLSALSIFNTTMNRPRIEAKLSQNYAISGEGFNLFQSTGCSDCHTPTMHTLTSILPYKITGENQLPFEDSFYQVDLTQSPMKFQTNKQGGIRVDLFSDLKLHFMGDALKETFTLATDKQNGEYITPRLWGVADSAPYLHDGRALTLYDAILAHNNTDSEALDSARNFENLHEKSQILIIDFLKTLRTPKSPNTDVAPK